MPEATINTEQHVLHIPVTVKELIEALIFAAAEPLTIKQLTTVFEESVQEGEHRSIEESEVDSLIATLNNEYQQAQKPYRIIKIAGGYQFATVVEYAEWVGKLYKEQGRRKLSQSSLETLAIIAYRQPITRPDIEAIRGVDCDYVLGTLLEKKLITISGRAPTPGRPLLYCTTDYFLKHFGLNAISDLPRPREIEELLADTRYETERRMLEAQELAEKAKKEEEDFKSRLPHIPKKKPEMDGSVSIVHKKLSRELSVKKGEESHEQIEQPQAALTVPEEVSAENLEVQAPEAFEQQEIQASVENSSDAQTIDVPVDLVPVGTTGDAASVELEEPQLEMSSEVVTDAVPDALTPTDEHIEAELSLAAPALPILEEKQPAVMPEAEHISLIEEKIVDGRGLINQTPTEHVDETTNDIVQAVVVEPEVVKPEMAIPERAVPEQAAPEIPEIPIVESQQPIEEESPTVSEQLPAPPPIEVAEAAPPAAPPRVAPIVDEVREPIQPKSRWQQFKETIQGFIKKVFG